MSGLDTLRKGVRARLRKAIGAQISRDAGIPMGTLEAFVAGAMLPEEVIQNLARETFNARWIPEEDKLTSLHQPHPMPAPLRPAPYLPPVTNKPHSMTPVTGRIGTKPGMLTPVTKRPGWA